MSCTNIEDTTTCPICSSLSLTPAGTCDTCGLDADAQDLWLTEMDADGLLAAWVDAYVTDEANTRGVEPSRAAMEAAGDSLAQQTEDYTSDARKVVFAAAVAKQDWRRAAAIAHYRDLIDAMAALPVEAQCAIEFARAYIAGRRLVGATVDPANVNARAAANTKAVA